MKRPNFFILGAPKCGTTSMAAWLSEHPNIFMSPIKEPFFFCTDLIPGHPRRIIGYEGLFSAATSELCTPLSTDERNPNRRHMVVDCGRAPCCSQLAFSRSEKYEYCA